MKATRYLAAILTALLLFSGCGTEAGDSESPEGALQIVTTIFPPYDFARVLGAEMVSVTMLLPPGMESHDFEPTPQDIIAIQNCDVFIYTGLEGDVWVEGIIENADHKPAQIIRMADLVAVLEEDHDHEEHDHEEEAHDHSEDSYDEHVWTAPQNAVKIVSAIAQAMQTADPDNAQAYQTNADAYIEELQALDKHIQQIVAEGVRNTVVFGDRFPVRYFTEAYGLTCFAAFPGCSSTTEPSAATVAELIDRVKAESIPVVFIIEFSNGKLADTICQETGAEKLLFHSCHNVSLTDFNAGVGYLNLMYQNAENLRIALS